MSDLSQLTVEANGLRFACLSTGPADGPLALCLHGFPDSARTWRHLLPELAGAGFRAVAPWLRGYAPTEIPADGHYQTGALVADAVALHGALEGDGQAVLIGHDWGALATYGAASFLARASAMLVTPFYVFAIPHLAEARNDPDDLRRRFLRICAQYTALSAAAVIAIAILRRQLVAVLLGSAYANAQTLLVPISVAIAIGGLAFIVCQLPMTVGSFRFVPWYAAAYVGEIMAVSMWHTTLLRVVYIVIAAQLVALAVIAFHARVKPLAQ